MKSLESQIKGLEILVNQLVSEHLVLKDQSQNTKDELAAMQLKLQERDAEVQSLKTQLERMRLARGLANDPQEAKAAKAKLGSLMREIDRCIALLNE